MLRIRRLNWDPGNIAHIALHQVTVDEAEEVCHGDPVSLHSYVGRIILIGPTEAGRMLAVVLDPAGEDVYYPVTARPASRKERRYYHQQKGGTQV
jgi:uncharacterized DUF497 family protein